MESILSYFLTIVRKKSIFFILIFFFVSLKLSSSGALTLSVKFDVICSNFEIRM